MCFTVQLSRFLSCDSHIRLSHLFWLVKNFFHFLENFFFQEFLKFLRAPLSPTAMLEYHSVFSLSTSFFNLLKIIYFIYNLEYSNNLTLLHPPFLRTPFFVYTYKASSFCFLFCLGIYVFSINSFALSNRSFVWISLNVFPVLFLIKLLR